MNILKRIAIFPLLLPLFASNNHDILQQSHALKKFINSQKHITQNVDEVPIFALPKVPTNLQVESATGVNFVNSTLLPFNRDMSFSDANHLLNRTVAGTSIDEINLFLEFNIDDGVEYLLREVESPAPPNDWVDHPFPLNYNQFSAEQLDSLTEAYSTQTRELIDWWSDRLFYHNLSIEEEMVYFWHDHFATSSDGIPYAPAMYHQNKLIRQYALGNFKTLVEEMTFDPAMMVWLNNNENTANSINENFGRELLELFTLGEGNYSQNDVYQAARGLTGYVTDGLNTFFVTDRFDDGNKTFLGQTGNFDTQDIIDIIFEQEQTAYFICEKLYKWFVYDIPNDEIVEELAQILRENNYEIKPVMETLLKSEHFFDDNFRGAKYKTPLHHTLTSLKHLNMDMNEPLDFEYTLKQITQYIWNVQGGLILYPPDVSGWPGYRNWINTYTLPWRKAYTNYIISGSLGGFYPDLVELTSQIPDAHSNPDVLLDYLFDYYYTIQPSELTKQQLYNDLLNGVDPSVWHLILYDGALEQFYNVVQKMMRLSEYQLK